jgi:hypothetical protein
MSPRSFSRRQEVISFFFVVFIVIYVCMYVIM